MKKTLFIAAVMTLLAFAVSCERENLSTIASDNLNISAVIDNGSTRVAYELTDAGLKQTWQVGDEIFGFAGDKLFTFVATSVAESGSATFEIAQGSAVPAEADGPIHMIYAPGYDATNLAKVEENTQLEIDLTNQVAGSIPAVMTATGAVSGNNLQLEFTNKTAIIGIHNFKIDATEGKTITSVAVGKVAAKGVITLVEGALTLAESAEAADVVKVSSDAGWPSVDGVVTADIYLAALPVTDEVNVSIKVDAKSADGYDYVVSLGEVGKIKAAQSYSLTGASLAETVVAKIGEVMYPSVEDAVAAANASDDDCTIVLQKDYTMTEKAYFNNLAGKVITLDLAGHTLIQNGTRRVGVDAGTVNVISSQPGAVISQDSASSNGFILAADGCTVNFKNIMAISYGTVANIYCNFENSKITAEDCVFINAASANAVSMTKESSTFEFIGDNNFLFGKITANTSITSGYFSIPVEGCAEGYGFEEIDPVVKSFRDVNYSFPLRVAKGAVLMVAKIGDTKYASVNEALAAANDADSDVTVTLTQNCMLNAPVTINNASAKITLDLCGKTLTAGSNMMTIADDGADVTITSSVDGGVYASSIKGTSSTEIGELARTIDLVNGKLTVTKATIKNSSSYAAVIVSNNLSGSSSQIVVSDAVIIGNSKAIWTVGKKNTTAPTVKIDNSRIEVTGSYYAIHPGSYSKFTITGSTLVSTSSSSKTGPLYIGATSASVSLKDCCLYATSPDCSPIYASSANTSGGISMSGTCYVNKDVMRLNSDHPSLSGNYGYTPESCEYTDRYGFVYTIKFEL